MKVWDAGPGRFAGSAYVRDIGLKPARRKTQLAVIIDVAGSSTRPDVLARDAADVCVCLIKSPMRIVAESPATATLPMSML
jgi:hypothetical protein